MKSFDQPSDQVGFSIVCDPIGSNPKLIAQKLIFYTNQYDHLVMVPNVWIG